jgi:hypothetical protein
MFVLSFAGKRVRHDALDVYGVERVPSEEE